MTSEAASLGKIIKRELESLTDEDRKLKRADLQNAVVGFLKEISDEKMQTHEWTVNVKETWFLPSEIFARWFDGMQVFDSRNDPKDFIEAGLLTNEEWLAILPFSKSLEKFMDVYYLTVDTLPVNLLEVQSWRDIVQLAQKTLDTLKSFDWPVKK